MSVRAKLHCHQLLPHTQCHTRTFSHNHAKTHVFSHVFTCTQGCFGSDVDPAYEEDITAFRDRFVELQEFTREFLDVGKLTVTWKIHLLVCHLKEWLRKYKESLARFSEQTCESTHFDFGKTHQRFKRKESHQDHGKMLKRSVVEYSSRRV